MITYSNDIHSRYPGLLPATLIRTTHSYTKTTKRVVATSASPLLFRLQCYVITFNSDKRFGLAGFVGGRGWREI
jgi:hypothetical protein